jgi:beta-1,4-mannosyl-glycoprotein beta-1,4-N-acetylglucosaminyltransferase
MQKIQKDSLVNLLEDNFGLDINHKPLLIDTFLFYNEMDLLKARLEYLGDTVDYFIISEANIDFSGKEKGFGLDKDVISMLPHANKIIYHREQINLNSFYWLIKRVRYRNRTTRLLWKIQDAQRNALLKPLRRFDLSDIIIFSDLDEFPNKKAIDEAIHVLSEPNSLQKHLCFSCQQLFFYYNIQNAAPKDLFHGSIFTNLGTLRQLLPHKLRSQKDSLPHIQNGGWHFSYFMDEEKILSKVLAISDVENLSQYKNLSTEEIRRKILSGIDLYDRQTELSKEEQKNLPASVLGPLKKYLPHCT